MSLRKLMVGICIVLLTLKGTSQVSGNIIVNSDKLFFKDLSWSEIKQKAVQEAKYIFVDCYATWCVPCKRMDKEVYTDEKLLALMKEKFISVKVQMDSTQYDGPEVKKWYDEARSMQQKFNVSSLPTFLFFSSDGKLIHIGAGFMGVDKFVQLAKDALDPNKQFYSQLESYRSGIRNYSTMASLARNTKEIYKEEAKDIAIDYKRNYLDKLADSSLFTVDNIRFVALAFPLLVYQEGSGGRFFRFFTNQPAIGDSLMGEGYSSFFRLAIINREEIYGKLFRDGKAIVNRPKWVELKRAIENKYPELNADSMVNSAVPGFYLATKNWKKWASIFEKQIKKTPPTADGKNLGKWGDAVELNEKAWTVFKFCNDKRILKKALTWSDMSIEIAHPVSIPSYYDTRANLLYKLGRRNEAIVQQERAIEVDNSNAIKEGKSKGDSIDTFTKTLKKMKNGEPTWPNN